MNNREQVIAVNGVECFLETHYEIVSHLEARVDTDGTQAAKAESEGGRGRMYELALYLTLKFEQDHQGEQWIDKDFFDTIDAFLADENSYKDFV